MSTFARITLLGMTSSSEIEAASSQAFLFGMACESGRMYSLAQTSRSPMTNSPSKVHSEAFQQTFIHDGASIRGGAVILRGITIDTGAWLVWRCGYQISPALRDGYGVAGKSYRVRRKPDFHRPQQQGGVGSLFLRRPWAKSSVR
ncbi:MAG: hypothetical protein JWQ69_2239 [Pseudomonas sp.]|nr:hypothetical protein [Pseudomonas sp.]